MFQLPSALNDETLHYVNLNRYTREGKPAEWMLGKFWQIDYATYWLFLEMLPPVYVAGGFRMIERLTGEIAATYFEIVGSPNDYWCAMTDLTSTRADKMLAHILRHRQG